MDLHQMIITIAAVLGVLVVGLLAVVPTVLEAPARARHRTVHQGRRRSGR